MTNVHPAVADAYALLRQDIIRYLDEADYTVTELDRTSLEEINSMRNLCMDLVHIVRGVLADHRESSVLTCNSCNQRWPCGSVRTIHGLVKDPDNEFLKIIQRAQEREDSQYQ